MRLLLEAYRSYLSGLTELRVTDPDELIAALEGWGVTGEGANPAAAVIDDAARAAGTELGRRAGELNTQRTRHTTRASELAEEIAGCAEAATTSPRCRIPARPASATAVPERRCGR